MILSHRFFLFLRSSFSLAANSRWWTVSHYQGSAEEFSCLLNAGDAPVLPAGPPMRRTSLREI